MTHPIIYLSGGLTSPWRERLVEMSDIATLLNPLNSELTNPSDYTAWNLMAIDLADIVLAYMESDNPSGIGLALEVGYAKARGKKIILADERSSAQPSFALFFATVRASADVVFDSLDEAVHFLATLLNKGNTWER